MLHVFTIYLFVLLGLSDATLICKNAPASCDILPPEATITCASFILRGRVPITTCTDFPETITKQTTITFTPSGTSTTTKQNPTRTTIISLYTTLTTALPQTFLNTSFIEVLVTSIQTIGAVTTDVQTAQVTTTIVVTVQQTITEIATITSTATFGETDTITSASTSTTTTITNVPWSLESCPVVARRRDSHGKDYDSPEKCTCFLTSTECGDIITQYISHTTQVPLVTQTITIPDSIVTVYEHITVPSQVIQTVQYNTLLTATSTVVGSTIVYSTAAIINTAVYTETSTLIKLNTETSTRTDIITISVTSTSTIQVNVTTTATTTQTMDPCATSGSQAFSLSNPNVVLGFSGDANNDPYTCCLDCHLNQDCAFWKLSADGLLCESFYTQRSFLSSCITSMCRRGQVPLIKGSPDGSTYGFGTCGQPPSG